MSMRILITGGRGFIAAALIPKLIARGDQVTVLSRSPESVDIPGVRVRGCSPDPGQLLGDAEAVVNLAGSPIFSKPGGPDELASSRVEASSRIMEALKLHPDPPRTWINASAVWIYGQTGDEVVDENHRPGSGPLVSLCNSWEDACSEAKHLGVRAVRLRAGLVLDEGGGPLSQLLPVFKFYESDLTGPGRRIISWIHREDMVGMILFCLDRYTVWGSMNAVSPDPRPLADFGRLLRRNMGTRNWDLVPGEPVSSLLPDAADIILQGCKVQPAKARSLGYEFQYENMQDALEAMYRVPVA
jgi:uncharacterized protein